MPILLKTAITKEATDAVTYDGILVNRLEIVARSVTTHSGRLVLLPYNTETGVVAADDKAIRLRVPNIQKAAEDSPKLALALASLIEAIQELSNEHDDARLAAEKLEAEKALEK